MKRICLSIIFASFVVSLIAAVPAFAQFDKEKSPKEKVKHEKVCKENGSSDTVTCTTEIVTGDGAQPMATTAPIGLGPMQIRKAYNVSGVATDPVIIGVVVAYHHPRMENDLNVYSNKYGLPRLPGCNGSITKSTRPCLKKADQRGGTKFPVYNEGWVYETALDVEIAHAMCQNCSILLVEADSSGWTDLLAAVDRARIMGAKIISMSWGAPEWQGQDIFDSYFNHRGMVYTASAGDSGYGAYYPAASQYVTAVGGTVLTMGPNNTYGGETVWASSGSACSSYEPKPSHQIDTACSKRTITDVSAVASAPDGGIATYVTTKPGSSWVQLVGTSISAPVIAGIYALAGGAPANVYGNALPYLRQNPTNMHDIVTGSNGTCEIGYFCTAQGGYDAPTGLGTPNGISAF